MSVRAWCGGRGSSARRMATSSSLSVTPPLGVGGDGTRGLELTALSKRPCEV